MNLQTLDHIYLLQG